MLVRTMSLISDAFIAWKLEDRYERRWGCGGALMLHVSYSFNM